MYTQFCHFFVQPRFFTTLRRILWKIPRISNGRIQILPLVFHNSLTRILLPHVLTRHVGKYHVQVRARFKFYVSFSTNLRGLQKHCVTLLFFYTTWSYFFTDFHSQVSTRSICRLTPPAAGGYFSHSYARIVIYVFENGVGIWHFRITWIYPYLPPHTGKVCSTQEPRGMLRWPVFVDQRIWLY